MDFNEDGDFVRASDGGDIFGDEKTMYDDENQKFLKTGNLNKMIVKDDPMGLMSSPEVEQD